MRAILTRFSQEIYTTALQMIEQGFSVIPVYGLVDAGKAKVAAVRWRRYQSQRATAEKLKQWFQNARHGGLGIVCGDVSGGLIVLDIDEPQVFIKLNKQFPQLLQTRIVKTPRGFHIYWRTESTTKTGKFNGGDLKAEGSYVIAPPTQIATSRYTIINDMPIRHVSDVELEAVLHVLRPTSTENQSHHIELNSQIDLINFYQREATTSGRNNALYTAARLAKSRGWTEKETNRTLQKIHITHPAQNTHRPETSTQRTREAQKTIASAFSKATTQTNTKTQLPNSVRESLIKLDDNNAALARTLEALFNDYAKRQKFTTEDAIKTCKIYGIGKHSVERTLRNKQIRKLMQCRVALPGKKSRGRPKIWYRLPSIEALCMTFHIELTGSDPLMATDLRSPHAYRRAMHREHISRRPGQYPLGWMGRRLGVSRWTIRRYNRALGVTVTPVYGYIPLKATKIPALIAEDPPPESYGIWLQDDRGKRYPPLREIAYKLLRRSPVILVTQAPNHYRLRVDGGGSVSAYWQCRGCRTLTAVNGTTLPSNCKPCAIQQVEEGRALMMDYAGEPQRDTVADEALVFPVQYASRTLNWDNVKNALPVEKYAEGCEGWLVAGGRRYPPLLGLACRLIKQHGEDAVTYVQRDRTAETYFYFGCWSVQLGNKRLAEMYFTRAGVDAVQVSTTSGV